MPELPEVEVLVRHLRPLLKGKIVRSAEVRRPKILAPTSEGQFTRAMRGAKFLDVTRRGKYLLFPLRMPGRREPVLLVGHLGMTGRMYLAGKSAALPKHTAVSMDLGKHRFVFEDTRYFGRLTLDTGALERLGPEPLEKEFTAEYLKSALGRSGQAVKVKLLDQALVAGVGNIYAGEALFRAAISPRMRADRLDNRQVGRLWRAIRQVLVIAIRQGSTLPIDIAGSGARDGLFYFGSKGDANGFYAERLLVYDRRGLPCVKCGTAIERLTQAARSTYFCPQCQRGPGGRGKIS
jgi:formamidopyrimidine-DNA glycosylase